MHKVGLFGFGCVGQGVYEIVNSEHSDTLQVPRVVAKSPDKPRPIQPSVLGFNKQEILDDETMGTIVEAIDDPEEAYRIVTDALLKGKNVVTANKKMIAEHLAELLELQKKSGKGLHYEASACASIPVIHLLEEFFGKKDVTKLLGIFNGSSNFILSKVFNQGLSYEDALRQAQELGFAESDPTLDVGGYDAKYKLIILALHAFGIVVPPSEVLNLGIAYIGKEDVESAKQRGLKIKQVARAVVENGRLSLRVLPEFVGPESPLYHVEEENNAVLIHSRDTGDQFFQGKGAGSLPTGSAVVADLHQNLAGRRYSYPKLNRNHGTVFSNQNTIEVYVNHRGKIFPDQIPFTHWESYQREYLIGDIRLEDLLRVKPLLEKKGVFVAATNGLITES